MAGATFRLGEQKVRPGFYVRVENIGVPAPVGVTNGTVAAMMKSSWGPLNLPVMMESQGEIAQNFGPLAAGFTTDTADQAFRGLAERVLGIRLGGSGVGAAAGAVATLTLNDTATTPAPAVTLTAASPGSRPNTGSPFGGWTVTVRDSLVQAGFKELDLYEGTTLLATYNFASGGTDEPALLVAAINAAADSYLRAALAGTGGNGTVGFVSNVPFVGGGDPTITSQDYLNALSALEADDQWNVLVIDTEDLVTQQAVQAWIDRVRSQGKRVMASLGVATATALADRQTNARAFNDFAIVYTTNGFNDALGPQEGYRAAARVGGMIAAAQLTDSLTHAVVAGALSLVGGLSNYDIEQSINSGCLVFSRNSSRQVQIEYGINTYITPDANHDTGWHKIRRVRTRDNLVDRIAASYDPLIGRIQNSDDGRNTLIAVAQGIVNTMIREGALLAGKVYIDPSHPPAGDAVWLRADVDDLDSAEHVYVTFGFRFAPPAAAA